jgi:hypothetical protein
MATCHGIGSGAKPRVDIGIQRSGLYLQIERWTRISQGDSRAAEESDMVTTFGKPFFVFFVFSSVEVMSR